MRTRRAQERALARSSPEGRLDRGRATCSSPRSRPRAWPRCSTRSRSPRAPCSSTPTRNENLRLSARNLENHQYLPPEGVNVYDLLRHEHLVLSKDAAAALDASAAASERLRTVMQTREHHQAPAAPHGEGEHALRETQQQVRVRGRLVAPTRSRSERPSRASSKSRVTDVRTMIVRGRMRRMGRGHAKTKNWKKAIVAAQRGRHDRVLRGSPGSSMAIKAFKPRSPARRYYKVADFKALDGNTAVVKKLIEHQPSNTAGRQQPRPHHLAFPRRRSQAALPHHRLQAQQDRRAREGRVARVRSEPARRASLSCNYARRREGATSSRPTASTVGDTIVSSRNADIKPGNSMPLRFIPVGTMIHNLGAARWQGRPARALRRRRPPSSWRRTATTRQVRLPSGEVRMVHLNCRADGRPGLEPRPREDLASARPVVRAGSVAAPAQPRRHDEPGRPPDGRW